jgi:hypothetical protein
VAVGVLKRTTIVGDEAKRCGIPRNRPTLLAAMSKLPEVHGIKPQLMVGEFQDPFKPGLLGGHFFVCPFFQVHLIARLDMWTGSKITTALDPCGLIDGAGLS